ncbi:MAG: aspartate aminotransferase family protein, partial [Chitinophagaceae bacterium]|nr:aspartate aminotransferase family protein [Chitinophagaceae bacterium]
SAMIETILGQLRIEGKLFVTPTTYQGTSCIRAALVNWRTEEVDIDIAATELISAYKKLNS